MDLTDERPKLTNKLINLEVLLGDALAALGRHAEAGEQYALADHLLAETYAVERAQYEKGIAEFEAKQWQIISSQNISAENRRIFLNAYDTARDALLSILDETANKRHDAQLRLTIAERRLTIARETGDADAIAKGFENIAKAYLALNDAASAQKFAEQALAWRQAHPRRRYLYDTYYLLGDIAVGAGDWNAALENYRQCVALVAPDALPAPFDETEAKEDMRAHFQRMNDFDRTDRATRALFARLEIVYIYQLRGNYRDASAEYEIVLQNIPTLYAMGAPDETELLAWIQAKDKAANQAAPAELSNSKLSIAEQLRAQIKSADVVAHRRTLNVKTDKNELERWRCSRRI